MSTLTSNDALNQLQDVISQVISGKRDPVAALKALELLAQKREKLRAKIGTVDLAVELVRETRDE